MTTLPTKQGAPRSGTLRVAEAIVTAGLGGALGWLSGGLVTRDIGLFVSVVAAINGVIGGWRSIYPWHRFRGWLAFALDSTWAAIPVAGSLIAHVIAASSRGEYVPELSVRQARHVYRRGMRLQPGMAFTIGNTISNAGDVSQVGRRSLVVHHEAVHVWQNRWFGPLYLLTYVVWSALGSAVGVLVWLMRGRQDSLFRVVNSCGYYLNPFEWWAYSRDDYWPPNGLLAGFGWKRPAVRAFATVPDRPDPPTPIV